MKKLLHTFSVTRKEQREIEETVTKGEGDEATEETTIKKVNKDVSYAINFYQPSRRQIEEAEFEYSIEMSKCIKKGILTRAMLAKQYSDSGGLISEEDAARLTELYAKLLEKQNIFKKIETKKGKKTKDDEAKLAEVTSEIAEFRREIVDLEMSYNNLFNHTADVKAQNKAIAWYSVHLAQIEDEFGDIKPFVEGENFEDKMEALYEIEEEDGENVSIAALAKDKLFTMVSFWYFSANASAEDFVNVEKEFDEGSL